MESGVISKFKFHFDNKTFSTLLLRGAGVIIIFSLSLLMTNNFSPDEVGQYEFIRVFLLVIGSICLFGTDISILYFAGRLKAANSLPSIKNIYFSILKVISLLSILFLGSFLLFFDVDNINVLAGDNFHSIILQSLVCLIFYAISLFNSELLRAIDKPVLSELFRNVFKYVPLGVGIILQITYSFALSISQYYIYGFIIVFIASQACVSYYLYKMPAENTIKPISTREVITKSFPMGVSSIIMFLLLSVDMFLLKRYYGNEVVAYYAIGIKLITLLSIIILSVNINVSSQISEHYSLNEKAAIQRLCRSTARKIFFVNLLIAVGMIILIEPLLLAFGEQYLYVKEAFYLLIISQLYTSALGVVPVYLNMTGRARVHQFILLFALICNIALNVILIPKYGVMGAAGTFSITAILWSTIIAVYVYKKDAVKLSFL